MIEEIVEKYAIEAAISNAFHRKGLGNSDSEDIIYHMSEPPGKKPRSRFFRCFWRIASIKIFERVPVGQVSELRPHEW